jgi:hypothetical protein
MMQKMEKGKYLRLQAQKKASRNFWRGTIRLAIVGLSGFLGFIYLISWISPLSAGQIEIWPTEISIDQIENSGFPEAGHLTVKDAYILFSEADIRVKNRGTEISYLSVPAVSRSLLEKWEAQKKQKKFIDASRFRLFVVFSGEQAARLWPSAELLNEKDRRKQTPVKMDLTGDTEPSKYWSFRPMKSNFPKKNLDWEKVRVLRFERHFHSLGRSIKDFAISVGLLALSVFVLKLHLKRRREPITPGTPDLIITHDDSLSNDDADLDIDID